MILDDVREMATQINYEMNDIDVILNRLEDIFNEVLENVEDDTEIAKRMKECLSLLEKL